MKPPIWLFLLIALLSSTAVLAQDAQHSDPCKAMPAAGSAAAKYFLTFEQFEKELRFDITRWDAVDLAFLVKFPLRINETGGGMISLLNAAALKSHFGEVFTPAVRKQILSQASGDLDDVDCDEDHILLAGGVIAVIATDRGYAISAVSQNGTITPETYYICQTQTDRIVVDAVAGGELRYRSWNKPRAVTEAPDLSITKGESTYRRQSLRGPGLHIQERCDGIQGRGQPELLPDFRDLRTAERRYRATGSYGGR